MNFYVKNIQNKKVLCFISSNIEGGSRTMEKDLEGGGPNFQAIFGNPPPIF